MENMQIVIVDYGHSLLIHDQNIDMIEVTLPEILMTILRKSFAEILILNKVIFYISIATKKHEVLICKEHGKFSA